MEAVGFCAENRWEELLKKVEIACKKAGRSSKEIQIVAVSKLHSIEKIKKFYEIGVRDFGENYVQELLEKQEALKDYPDIRWHFIGKMQSNKVKNIANRVKLIHSLDRISLLEILEKRINPKTNEAKQDILIQLEVSSADENKGGVPYAEAMELVQFVKAAKNIRCVGFMGMGPQIAYGREMLDPLYKTFQCEVSRLWERIGSPIPPIVSLGMSGDLEAAVAHGSTMIRVGTALFGERGASG